MAEEFFEKRVLTGDINLACKYDDGSVRYWVARKEDVIEHIKEIVDEFQEEGYVLTLRQLHYQLVTKNYIINHDSAYKKLSNILDDCRYAGIIDWDAIEDRGRVPYLPYWAHDSQHALQDTIDQFRIDRQKGQSNYVELWTEKDALSGILKRTTEKYHIQLVVNKGYTSSSAIYNAYQRFVYRIRRGQRVTILYFGDHDPSGLDMIRDIRERLLFFMVNGESFSYGNPIYDENISQWWDDNKYSIHDIMEGGYSNADFNKLLQNDNNRKGFEEFEKGKIRMYLSKNKLFQVIPIGLTMQQIKRYKLPPNPTKLTDSRSDKYIDKFGKTCWEVDALKPQVLTQIVETNIEEQIDIKLFGNVLKTEAKELGILKGFVKKSK